MAFTFALNDRYSDLIINKAGKLATVYGAEEVRQRVMITLRHEWEEYFLNVPAGLPWKEVILGSKDPQIVEALIRRAVLQVPRVLSIISIRVIQPKSANDRQFTVEMRIEVQGIQGPSLEDISFSLGV